MGLTHRSFRIDFNLLCITLATQVSNSVSFPWIQAIIA